LSHHHLHHRHDDGDDEKVVMMSYDSFIQPEIATYLLEHLLREPAVLRDLRERTAQLPLAFMQVPPEEGQFLHFIVQLMQAKKP